LAWRGAAGLEDCRCRLAIMSSAKFTDNISEREKENDCESVPLRQKPHEGQRLFIARPARETSRKLPKSRRGWRRRRRRAALPLLTCCAPS
jgi:hypothetical protein